MNASPPAGGPLAVLGFGLCTPLGLGARVSSAEMAAGTRVFAETDVSDRTGQPARASRLSLIARGSSRTERMLALARTALADLLAQAPPELTFDRVPILLALPAADEGGAPFDPTFLASAIAEAMFPAAGENSAAPARRAGPQPRLISRGRAALFSALIDAAKLLQADSNEAVLIGAIDSLCDRASMQLFARTNRILCAANADGLIPGEAAGFLIVGRSRRRGDRGRLLAHAIAHGPGRSAPASAAGQALAEVLNRLAGSSPDRPTQLLSAQPGERCWSRELRTAMLRAPRGLPEPFTSRRITESVGDAGAAAAMALTVAALASRAGPATGPTLVYGSSDDGLVGGLLLEAA